MDIIFRGKKLSVSEPNEWIYGSLIIDKYKSASIYIPQIYDGHHIDMETSSRYIDPDTAGQYIGISDKNKTKIFDGDIVRHVLWNKLLVVKYSLETNGFILLSIKNNTEQYIPYNHQSNLIVVGNIYDNKELLK